MQVLTTGDFKIVPQQMSLSGVIRAVAVKPEEQKTGINAFIFHLVSGKKSETVYMFDREEERIAAASFELDDNTVNLYLRLKRNNSSFCHKAE